MSTPTWSLNGVNMFSEDLARTLAQKGFQSEIMLTRPDKMNRNPVSLPENINIHRFPDKIALSRKSRLSYLLKHLTKSAPCVFIPNYDYDSSAVSCMLPPEVKIIGIIHSDDPEHYEHAGRYGKHWDHVVCVSHAIKSQVLRKYPWLSDRISVIAYGTDRTTERETFNPDVQNPLRLIYAGRLVQYQKQVFRLPKIAKHLYRMKIPFIFEIAGDGLVREKLLKKMSRAVPADMFCFSGTLSRNALQSRLRQSDVLILPSDFEGFPISLIEAMNCGCVPVVSKIRSGVPELIENGDNGLLISSNHPLDFASAIASLHHKRERLRDLSLKAQAKIKEMRLTHGEIAEKYMNLITCLFEKKSTAVRFPNLKKFPHAPLLPLPASVLLKRVPDMIRMMNVYRKRSESERDKRF